MTYGIEPRVLSSEQVPEMARIVFPILDKLIPANPEDSKEWKFLTKGHKILRLAAERPEDIERRSRLELWLCEFANGEYAVFGRPPPEGATVLIDTGHGFARVPSGCHSYADEGYGSETDYEDLEEDDDDDGDDDDGSFDYDQYFEADVDTGDDGDIGGPYDYLFGEQVLSINPVHNPDWIENDEAPVFEDSEGLIGFPEGIFDALLAVPEVEEVPTAPPKEGMWLFGVWWPPHPPTVDEGTEPAPEPEEEPEEDLIQLPEEDDDDADEGSDGDEDSGPDVEAELTVDQDDHESWNSTWGPAEVLEAYSFSMRPCFASGSASEELLEPVPEREPSIDSGDDEDSSSEEESDDDFWA